MREKSKNKNYRLFSSFKEIYNFFYFIFLALLFDITFSFRFYLWNFTFVFGYFLKRLLCLSSFFEDGKRCGRGRGSEVGRWK
jgi:hypothetical protein